MIKTIAIVGGGFAGWYTAAALAHNFPQLKITVIDSDRHSRLGVGETLGFSAPYDWKRLLGLKDDRELMFRTGAVYKYGTTAENFYADNDFISYGKFFNLKIRSLVKFYGEFDYPDYHEHWNNHPGDVGLQQAWMTINKYTGKNIHDYIAELNEASHFTQNPVAPYDRNNRYILRPTEGWSYQIDAEQTVDFLKELACKNPGQTLHVTSAVRQVELTSSGSIVAIGLENDQSVKADLYVDATGSARVILRQSSNNTWLDQGSDYCNSAWVCPTAYTSVENQLIGATKFYGEDWGWRFQIGLYHRMGNGYIFNSHMVDRQIPLARLLRVTDNRLAEPRLIQWVPGYFREAWHHNLLALGISSHLIDPFDAPTFDIHSQALNSLIKLLNQDTIENTRSSFNRDHQLVVEERNMRLRFVFGLSRRTGTFWDSRRALLQKHYTMQDFQDILNAKKTSLQDRLPHWWQQMYYRMCMAAGLDRTQFDTVEMNQQDQDMANAFFAYNRSRNRYISQQTWPNYYGWLRTNRFNDITSEQILQRLNPGLVTEKN